MDVIGWLLAGDPAVAWQTLRDLSDAAPDQYRAVRARVEHQGWGARLLAAEDDDGTWAGGACFPGGYDGTGAGQPWTATMHSLQTLLVLGLDPQSAAARRAVALIDANGRWEHAGQRYFDGEVEPCINGRTIEAGAYFAVDVAPLVERVLGEQLSDGGWNCEAESGSIRSSFDTTINVLDGLLAYERAAGAPADVVAARRRAEEYLLERELMRRLTTGGLIRAEYLAFAFPYYWHYDVLRALDYFRRTGADPDPRQSRAIAEVRSRRRPDGRWPVEPAHPGAVHLDIEAAVGTPGRWNTLRALRVLQWWDSGVQRPGPGPAGH